MQMMMKGARATPVRRTTKARSAMARRAVEETETATTAAAPEVTPQPGFKEAMAVGGWAPEVINGRLAQLGFIAGVGCELGTGETLPVQFTEHFGIFAAHSLVFAIASFMPSMQGASDYTSDPRTIAPFGAFNAKAEMTNGRGAMVGLAAMLVIESVTGQALIPFAPEVEPKSATYVPMTLDSYEGTTDIFASEMPPAMEAPAPAVAEAQQPTVVVDDDLVAVGAAMAGAETPLEPLSD